MGLLGMGSLLLITINTCDSVLCSFSIYLELENALHLFNVTSPSSPLTSTKKKKPLAWLTLGVIPIPVFPLASKTIFWTQLIVMA